MHTPREMDKDSLLNLVIEKNRRIKDLERLVEDQRYLRLQDANQVEEKAAKIKEWVAKKLEELENQNKQLRDQNKKQNEVVELLTNKLAALTRRESPVYDSVTADHLNKNNNRDSANHDGYSSAESPPTPPLHRSDKWELQLCSPAHQTLSTLMKEPDAERFHEFISADLIKRGYLIKSGALKNHSRWFVLKNFHLYTYKMESEETTKSTPSMKLKLDSNCQIYAVSQSNETSFQFRLSYSDKNLQLIADSAQVRDEWIKIITIAINMSDLNQDNLTKSNATYQGMMSVTQHGLTKKYYATLINHVVFLLKQATDSTPMSYLSVKECKIREITDKYDYDSEEQEFQKHSNNFQDCSLAIYPRYSMTPDPVYITLGCQQDIDKWFYFLSSASGVDQAFGTQFERTLTRLMVNSSMSTMNNISTDTFTMNTVSGCLWKEHSIMFYSDRPISQPLTSLPNETLRMESIELFKSILLFSQVPIEPTAIDYHVCLLQNCLGRFLKYPELRNEFYAQLIKQCTYVLHQCSNRKLSTSSSGCSPVDQRLSMNSLSPSSSECQFLTDTQLIESMMSDVVKLNQNSTPLKSNSIRDSSSEVVPPSQSELLQVVQIIAVAVSLNLPRGRMRWWLMDHMRKFANSYTQIGKYALYTLRAIDRTILNGTRTNVPSRTEILSILLRNPQDHSNPHSLPVSFSDGSYLVVEADGSTTVYEFMVSMTKDTNIRHSLLSDFYLFADDPSGSKGLHILEPERKILDIVGWWEQACRRHNSGRYQSTKTIKLLCKKKFVLRAEDEETNQEKFLIVHQIHQEIVSQQIPLSETLIIELAAIMAQLTHGDFDSTKDPTLIKYVLDKISLSLLPSQIENHGDINCNDYSGNQFVNSWIQLSGKSSQDCVRLYLNRIKRQNPE